VGGQSGSPQDIGSLNAQENTLRNPTRLPPVFLDFPVCFSFYNPIQRQFTLLFPFPTSVYNVHIPELPVKMAKAKEEANATPAKPPSSLKKQSSSSGPQSGQRSIHSFFSKAPASGTPSSSNGVLKASDTSKGLNAMAKPTVPVKKPAFKKTAVKNITPVPSSDAMGPSSSQENENGGIPEEVEDTGLPSPSTPAKKVQQVVKGTTAFGSSPSRKVCKGALLS